MKISYDIRIYAADMYLIKKMLQTENLYLHQHCRNILTIILSIYVSLSDLFLFTFLSYQSIVFDIKAY